MSGLTTIRIVDTRLEIMWRLFYSGLDNDKQKKKRSRGDMKHVNSSYGSITAVTKCVSQNVLLYGFTQVERYFLQPVLMEAFVNKHQSDLNTCGQISICRFSIMELHVIHQSGLSDSFRILSFGLISTSSDKFWSSI